MRMLRLPALALVAAALACGGGDADQAVQLNGAGATFPNIIYSKWILDYNAAHPAVEINYQSIGSGGGIAQFTDKTVDFGASDAPMNAAELAAVDSNVLHIPTVLGAVCPVYNVQGIEAGLKFTPAVLASIYLGQITRWNDVRIAAANPGVTLPDEPIVVVHRSDGSGTSYIFTEYLTKVSPDWAQQVGTGKAVNWPAGIGGRGNEGVSASVRQTDGAIGYVELGYALINGMTMGAVQNSAGTFVTPSIASVTAAAAGAMSAMGPNTDFRVSITNPAGADAYPISSFTWLLLRRDYGTDTTKARALVRFVHWAETEGQAAAPDLGYAPLPEALRPWIDARLQTITAGGQPVWSGGQ